MTGETRWRGLWTLVVVLVLAGGAAVLSRTVGAQRPLTGPVADQLAERVSRLMETDFSDRVTAGPGRLRCAARPFAAHPERPTSVRDVATVYAWVHCRRAAGSGGAELLPVAIRFDDPPSVRVPVHGDDRARSIRRIFPPDVRDAMAAVDTARLAAGTGPRAG